ncbi:MAG: acetyl-CoA carboxylase carboxyltransferase subunit alpha [Chlamydiae bacterium]|jgi:acetyl-CoA carboxylase carboxyl transferase subunit alpha|nr:acetyl-CoA carboxylase carboxyltransferase subunit alpha [Chlamydiota bacterium]
MTNNNFKSNSSQNSKTLAATPLDQKEYSAWERVQICRHPERPHASDFIKNICDNFTEMHGDRLFGDDGAIIGGVGYIGGERCVIIGQEKGKCTESRLKRNFGMPHPEGYRKALRLMKFAEKFELPIVTLIDTAGAFPGLAAEERGQGSAIATNLLEMAKLRVPIICVLIGEGCSGGALGIGVGDTIGMLEHSYYSVISPEGCASILWKDAKMNAHAAEVLKIHAEDLIEYGIVDEVIKEPKGGAHLDPPTTFSSVKNFILSKITALKGFSSGELLENRYQKFREMGQYDTIASS